MSSKNNNSADSLGKITNTDVDKKSSSLILNYGAEKVAEKAAPASGKTEKAASEAKTETGTKKENNKKKSKIKNLSKASEAAEKNKEELKQQVESLKKIKNFLNMEVSVLIGMGIAVIKKINKKLFGAIEVVEPEKNEEEIAENVAPEPTGPFSFKSLIDMNIIFTDN
jgi:predicted RNase H-like nuclease (RuvC/YqgF family)